MTATWPAAAGSVRQVIVGQAGTGSTAEPYGAGPDPARGGAYASDARTPASNRTYPLANRLPAAGEGGEAGTGRSPSLVERGYVHARFGGVPVLVGPELAAQLKAIRQKQS